MQVAKTLGLREVWYFGLQTLDSENRRIWLKYSKKVLPQITKYQGKIDRNGQNSTKKPHVLFIVKFFPEDVEKELIQEITLVSTLYFWNDLLGHFLIAMKVLVMFSVF